MSLDSDAIECVKRRERRSNNENKKRLGLKLWFERFFDMEKRCWARCRPPGQPPPRPVAASHPPGITPLGPRRAAAALGASKQHSAGLARELQARLVVPTVLLRPREKTLGRRKWPCSLPSTCTLVLAACAAVLARSFVFACLCCWPALRRCRRRCCSCYASSFLLRRGLPSAPPAAPPLAGVPPGSLVTCCSIRGVQGQHSARLCS